MKNIKNHNKVVKKDLISFLKGKNNDFNHPCLSFMSAARILRSCGIKKIGKTMALISSSVTEVKTYKIGYFNLLIVLPHIETAREICLVNRIAPKVLIIDAVSAHLLARYYGNGSCKVYFKTLHCLTNHLPLFFEKTLSSCCKNLIIHETVSPLLLDLKIENENENENEKFVSHPKTQTYINHDSSNQEFNKVLAVV